jgi:hypothetical protein
MLRPELPLQPAIGLPCIFLPEALTAALTAAHNARCFSARGETTTLMSYYSWLLVGSIGLLTGLALLALRWALAHGEFRSPNRTALLIFDDEEPVGKQSDFFPGHVDKDKPKARATDP